MMDLRALVVARCFMCAHGYIAQWPERLTADQQVPDSSPGVLWRRDHGNMVCARALAGVCFVWEWELREAVCARERVCPSDQ